MSATRCAPCRLDRHDGCTGHGCECECRDLPALDWSDPPQRGRKPAPLADDVVQALRLRPGKWAKVAEYDGRSAGQTRANRWRNLHADDGLEFRAARVGDGSAVWARSVAEAAKAAS